MIDEESVIVMIAFVGNNVSFWLQDAGADGAGSFRWLCHPCSACMIFGSITASSGNSEAYTGGNFDS